MSSVTLNTPFLRERITRWQAGDRRAAEELLTRVEQSFHHLVQRLFRGFPQLHSHLETSDVYQGAMQRLLRTLQHLTPVSTDHFLSLLTLHIRRELIDLTRHFAAVHRQQRELSADVADPHSQSAEDLDLWTRFHEAIGNLSDDERAVMELVFYQGCTQAQIVELLGVSERTVRRRWQTACLRLNEMLGGQIPVAGD